MNSQPGTAADLASVAEPVAMVLSRQAKPGHERAFEEVFHRRGRRHRETGRHPGGPPIYTIVSHFQTRADADAWLASPERARLVAEAGLHSAGELQTRYVSGLEGWLAALGAPVLVAPARWKTALVSAVAFCRCWSWLATFSVRGWPHCRYGHGR
jgi:antibiotic biosynthesis monooxygenase (ABM) superfamily enzyme